MKNEITILITDPIGTQHTLQCPTDIGLTLKDIRKAYELPMETICGGMAMCITCHSYILKDDATLPEKIDAEDALLSELFNAYPNSRLACQIHLTTKMDALSVEIAAD